jgi:hypothetical protein
MTNKKQIHNRLSSDQVNLILEKYLNKEIKAKQARNYLELSKSRFYEILKQFKIEKESHSIEYKRTQSSNKITTSVEWHIIDELKIEKEKIIDNPNTPTNYYNYSYIKGLIKDKYWESVSLPTIVKKAKENWFYKEKKKSNKIHHDREVITNYPWELIQHDSSHHLFAPDAMQKWYLVTSIDDYSRWILFADLFEKESTWIHIQAVEHLCINYWFPFKYYPDQHCIFRYVKDRDKNSIHMNFTKFTDDINPQWKQVLEDCNIQVTYALSPQAKWKVERPYKWLQDHLVRTCLRKWITNIQDAREVLKEEVYNYNYRKTHSTTGEIPMIRFNNAISINKTLFRPFEIPSWLKSVKDVFCLRESRVADAYRKISFHWLSLKISWVEPRDTVELRMYPEADTWLIEIRFWSRYKHVDTQIIKACDLKVNF